MMAKKTLEINPHHSVMKEMLAKLKDSVDEKMDEQTEEMANVLYHMALINSGFEIGDPSAFTGNL
jgi:molecular chaperone HtpG